MQVFWLGTLVNALNNIEYEEPLVVEIRPQTIEERIEYYSELYGADVDLALSIAWCESNYIETASNPHSSAEGIFQFIDGTWEAYCEGDKLNADDNIKCATRLLANGGVGHWNASRHCWSTLAMR